MSATATYTIRVDKQIFQVDDPVITGRQILDKAKLRPADEHLVFLKLNDAQLEEIRLDEQVNLRQRGVEKFMTFRSDRTFYFSIDGRRLPWGAPVITGKTLRKLGEVEESVYDLYQVSIGTKDHLIGNTDEVSLDAEGLERFFSVKKATTEGSEDVA